VMGVSRVGCDSSSPWGSEASAYRQRADRKVLLFRVTLSPDVERSSDIHMPCYLRIIWPSGWKRGYEYQHFGPLPLPLSPHAPSPPPLLPALPHPPNIKRPVPAHIRPIPHPKKHIPAHHRRIPQKLPRERVIPQDTPRPLVQRDQAPRAG